MEIELLGVTVDYAGTRPLENLSARFPVGTTAVMGPSGSGKSSLLRLIAGLQAPARGSVTIAGDRVKPASWRTATDPRVALIHQDYRLVPFLSVRENLLLAAEMRGRRPSAAAAAEALAAVGLDAVMLERLPSTMSGGEQQRVAIARALVAGTPVLLADEPTGALDTGNTQRVTDTLVELGRHYGLVVVVATHDHRVAERLDRTLHLGGSVQAA